MELNFPPERAQNSDPGGSHGSRGSQPEFEEVTIEEEELDGLAEEVQQMANKIQEYRATLPDQLKTTLASLLSSQRTLVPEIDSSGPGPSGEPAPESRQVETRTGALRSEEEDRQTGEKVKLLKDKLAKNASSMPMVMKRMKDCMSKIDMLESSSSEPQIHPVFRKKRDS
ncbi:hypothetical protein LINGRAHAP2_LOCUS214 [Linum grandiflorum]